MVAPCGIYFPDQGLNPEPLHWEFGVLVTGAVLSHSVLSDSLPARLLCPWGFSRQEYWTGLPFPSPGDLPNPEIEPRSPHCRRILHPLSHQGSPAVTLDLTLIARSLNCHSSAMVPVHPLPVHFFPNSLSPSISILDLKLANSFHLT